MQVNYCQFASLVARQPGAVQHEPVILPVCFKRFWLN